MDEVARILFYGLAAAASPITLLATFVVLRSGHGRLTGAAFMVAFLFGQSVAFLVAFFVGAAFTANEHSTLAAYLEFAGGCALLVLAWRARPPHEPTAAGSAPRTEALFTRLERVNLGVALGIGIMLGIGTKRLAITIVAATTVALSGLSPLEEVGLGCLYVVVATLVVWVPVSLYLIFGKRADELMGCVQVWVTAQTQMLIFISALVLGVLFILDATIRLAV